MIVAGDACVSKNGSTPVTLSVAAPALPETGGSGSVRDLGEAMSLGANQAAALAATVQDFAGATTRDAQRAPLDDVLRLRSKTNPVQTLRPMNDPHRRFVKSGYRNVRSCCPGTEGVVIQPTHARCFHGRTSHQQLRRR